MCCSGGAGGSRMTRCGVFCGLAALAALTTALLGPAWLHTEERFLLPHLPRHLANLVSVKFKLGLFKVCPKIVKPVNLTVRKYFSFNKIFIFHNLFCFKFEAYFQRDKCLQ